MPIVLTAKAPNRDAYESVARILGLDSERPAGLLMHAASEAENGEVEIVDVWESADQLEAFESERLFPAFATAGVGEAMQAAGGPVARTPFDYLG